MDVNWATGRWPKAHAIKTERAAFVRVPSAIVVTLCGLTGTVEEDHIWDTMPGGVSCETCKGIIVRRATT